MNQYPHDQPLLLTDEVFTMYGGETGTTTAAQRQAAYHLAEMQMTDHLSAFLVPTIITGSANWLRDNLFEMEYGYLLNIHSVYGDVIQTLNPLVTTIATGTSLIRNSEQGLIDIFIPCNYRSIYQMWVVYESGLSSGTSTQPALLSALALAAQIHLNEWDLSLANEGIGDIGIQSFSNQSYAEHRKFLGNTVFGNSAYAQRIKKLTQRYRVKTGFGFR